MPPSFEISANKIQMEPEPSLLYVVRLLINNEMYYGELTIDFNQDNKLFIYDFENPNNQAQKITFLNRLAVKRVVLV